MKSQWLTWIKGYVTVEIRGSEPEKLINALTDKRLQIWQARRVAENKMVLHIHLRDVFRLRPLLKQTGCRMHVLNRFGLPFLLARMEKRKFFVAGIAGFFAALYILSSVVWQVNVVGNERIPTEDVLNAARQQGIYRLQFLFRLDEPDMLSRKLMQTLPDTAWVGVKIDGTSVTIRVVEAVKPEEKPLMNPRHLIASSDAVITQILAEKGKPMVRPNDRVKQGDILISGRIGGDELSQIVVAEGTVKGLVWHLYRIEQPLLQKYKVYTGDTRDRQYLVIGNRALQITGYGKKPYDKSESTWQKHLLHWRDFQLPVGWMTEKVREVRFVQSRMSKETALERAMLQARADILTKYGYDAEIREQNILEQTVEKGKLYLPVHFEVEQDIAVEQPIIPDSFIPDSAQTEQAPAIASKRPSGARSILNKMFFSNYAH